MVSNNRSTNILVFTGTVVKGDAEARIFGFPTANIELTHTLQPGIYAGSVDTQGKTYVAAIIVNPKKAGKVIEAHLIDFKGDLYGYNITLRVGNFLRGWVPFPTLVRGREQIAKDIEVIKSQI